MIVRDNPVVFSWTQPKDRDLSQPWTLTITNPSGAVVRRAIIAEGAEIGPGAVVGEETGAIAVVGQNVKLSAGEVVKAGEQRAE